MWFSEQNSLELNCFKRISKERGKSVRHLTLRTWTCCSPPRRFPSASSAQSCVRRSPWQPRWPRPVPGRSRPPASSFTGSHTTTDMVSASRPPRAHLKTPAGVGTSVGSYNPGSEHNTSAMRPRFCRSVCRFPASGGTSLWPLVLRPQPSASVCFSGASAHPSISD